MSNLAVHPFTGAFRAQPDASTFAFAVRHSGTFWFRGTVPEVEATLRVEDGRILLEGAADVGSISIVEPAAMRASVLGKEFFDAEQHPAILFRSTDVRLTDDGQAELIGELTMKGITRSIAARGTWSPPIQATFGEIAGLQFSTTIDRRDFGFDWQMPMPGGGDAVGWEVKLDIDLLLVRDEADAGE